MSDEHTARSFEIALALMGALLATAAGVLLMGRISGSRTRHRGQTEGAPTWGSVPAERHQHIGSSSPR